jgi:hypothetical protein
MVFYNVSISMSFYIFRCFVPAFFMTLFVSGCATIEKRPLLSNPPKAINLETDFKINGKGLDAHNYTLLPAGRYVAMKTPGGNFLYMREGDSSITVKMTIGGKRVLQGGIVYFVGTENLLGGVHGRFFTFFDPDLDVFLNHTKIMDADEFTPVHGFLIPDDMLRQFKDDEGKPLELAQPQ